MNIFLYFYLVNLNWINWKWRFILKDLNEQEILRISKCTQISFENSYRFWVAQNLDAQLNWLIFWTGYLFKVPYIGYPDTTLNLKSTWLIFSADNLGHRYFSWSTNNILRVCILHVFSSSPSLKSKIQLPMLKEDFMTWAHACISYHIWSLKSAILFLGFVQDRYTA